ncbi:hypothetical protein ALC57_18618 [Trachymyrmex cornetzi]|uniref:Uncharacterized protein n=1 Tax=Trachymyrmex cornetzi TaxID=471704 RepID=A0A151IRG5_9HYME|nr:hypothetical protein ALC57_18618 [Trachymyrmex cornetzi]
MEARRITGAAYKASSDAMHGAEGRRYEREEAGMSERRKGRAKDNKNERAKEETDTHTHTHTHTHRERERERRKREEAREREQNAAWMVYCGLKMKDKGRRWWNV